MFNSAVVRFLFLVAVCFDLNQAKLDHDGSVQCKGKPDGTTCTLPCRALNCAPPYTRCCAGRCFKGNTTVDEVTNKADLCPSTPVVRCKGKPDGTPCIKFCKARNCAPPYTRCCAGGCYRGNTPVDEVTNKVDLCPSSALIRCKGKPDGTPCIKFCKALNCGPPYTRCCAGRCHSGNTPVYEVTNKADLCPVPAVVRCKGKPDGTPCIRLCGAWNCVPPYTRCCAGRCHRGNTPVDKFTNKAEICLPQQKTIIQQ